MSKTPIEELESQVRSFITDNFHVGKASLTRDDSLLNLGIIDSTGYLEVFHWLSEDFGIAVRDDEMNPDHFETIARIASFIHDRQA